MVLLISNLHLFSCSSLFISSPVLHLILWLVLFLSSPQFFSAAEITARLLLRPRWADLRLFYRSLCCRPNTCAWQKFTSLHCCVSSKWRLSEPRCAVHLAPANTEPKHSCDLITSIHSLADNMNYFLISSKCWVEHHYYYCLYIGLVIWTNS